MGPTDDTQASRESPIGVAAVLALDSRVTSMISDELSRDHERSESILHRTPQGRTLEAGGSEGSIGGTLDASGTAPVGLGLGGFQPLPTRVSNYMIVMIDIEVTGFGNVPPHDLTIIFRSTFTLFENLMLEGICYDC